MSTVFQSSGPILALGQKPMYEDMINDFGKAGYLFYASPFSSVESFMKKNICIVVKDEDNARHQADRFEKWLENKGVYVIRLCSGIHGVTQPERTCKQSTGPLFCVFVLGGDGTFLSAVRWIGDRQTPIIGVKFGEVGFLAETTEDHLCEVAEAIIDNQFITRPQMRLTIQVFRENVEVAKESAFNDVVINKGALARLARIRTHIDDQFLTDYRADGLIIATPTGSTAYSLAAGGPIIHPTIPGILITPICPFTLTNRPLMVPDSSTVQIQLVKDVSDIMLTCDGQVGLKIDERDTIIVSKSSEPVRMITLPDQNYYDVLKAKLKWSGSRV